MADLLKTSNAALIFLFQQKSNKVGQQLLMTCFSVLFLAKIMKTLLSLLLKRRCSKFGNESMIFLLFSFIISCQIRKKSFACLAVIILHLLINSLFNLPQSRAKKPFTAKKSTQAYLCIFTFTILLFYKRALRLAAIFYRNNLSTTNSKTLLLFIKGAGLIQLATGSPSTGWMIFLLMILARGDSVDLIPFYPYGESAEPNAKLTLFFLIKLGLSVTQSGSVLILLLLVLLLMKGSEMCEERRESCRYSWRFVRVMGCLMEWELGVEEGSCSRRDSVFSDVALVSSMDYFLLVRLNLPPVEVGSTEEGSSSLEAEFTLESVLNMLVTH